MMEYSLDGHNVSLSAIRTVRVLRPLRAINRVPSKQPPPPPGPGTGLCVLPALLSALKDTLGSQNQKAMLPTWLLDAVAPA